jgi:uncharacterized YccA/Bax inhibitor family protein
MSNPILSEKSFERFSDGLAGRSTTDVMTLQGTINKSILLFITMVIPAAWIWWMMGGYDKEAASEYIPYLIGSAIAGFVISLILMFKQSWAPILAPIYAAVEGVFIGLISMIFNYMYDGIVMQAVFVTLVIFTAMLVAYKTGLLRATPMFTKIIVFATMGVGIFYLITMIMGMFGVQSFYNGNSWLSIGVSALIAGIAAFNLILDFNMIEEGSKNGFPKYMEWYCAFGLLVTIVWLYLEILRLLAKLNSRE